MHLTLISHECTELLNTSVVHDALQVAGASFAEWHLFISVVVFFTNAHKHAEKIQPKEYHSTFKKIPTFAVRF